MNRLLFPLWLQLKKYELLNEKLKRLIEGLK